MFENIVHPEETAFLTVIVEAKARSLTPTVERTGIDMGS
jgi:hypothetical protein